MNNMRKRNIYLTNIFFICGNIITQGMDNYHSWENTYTVRNMQQQITFVDVIKQGEMNPI